MRLAGSLLLFALVWLTACQSEDEQQTLETEPPDTSSSLSRAVQAMNQLSSYRVDVEVAPPAYDPLRKTQALVDVVPPDSYRVVTIELEGDTKDVCESYTPRGGGFTETCRPVLTSVTGRSIVEVISFEGTAYLAGCDDPDGPCQQLQTIEVGMDYIPPIHAPSAASYPQSPLVALELATSFEDLGVDQIEGSPLVHMQGTFNPILAFFETEERLFGGEPPGGGVECGGTIGFGPDEQGSDGVECVETGDGTAADWEEEIRFYDGAPAPIDVWFSTDDYRIHRVRMMVPDLSLGIPLGRGQRLLPVEELEVTFIYSKFDQVTIQILENRAHSVSMRTG